MDGPFRLTVRDGPFDNDFDSADAPPTFNHWHDNSRDSSNSSPSDDSRNGRNNDNEASLPGSSFGREDSRPKIQLYVDGRDDYKFLNTNDGTSEVFFINFGRVALSKASWIYWDEVSRQEVVLQNRTFGGSDLRSRQGESVYISEVTDTKLILDLRALSSDAGESGRDNKDKYGRPMAIRIYWAEPAGFLGHSTSEQFSLNEGPPDGDLVRGFRRARDESVAGDMITEERAPAGIAAPPPAVPSEGPWASMSSVVPTAAPTSSSSSEPSLPATTNDAGATEGGGGGSGGLSTGAIAGIGAGAGVLAIAIIAGLIYFCIRRRRNSASKGRDGDQTSSAFMVDKDGPHVSESVHTPPYSDDGRLGQPSTPLPHQTAHGDRPRPSHDGRTGLARHGDARSARDSTGLSSRADATATPQGVSSRVAHLIEDGMTPDEIARLEEEERQLDDEIERSRRR